MGRRCRSLDQAWISASNDAIFDAGGGPMRTTIAIDDELFATQEYAGLPKIGRCARSVKGAVEREAARRHCAQAGSNRTPRRRPRRHVDVRYWSITSIGIDHFLDRAVTLVQLLDQCEVCLDAPVCARRTCLGQCAEIGEMINDANRLCTVDGASAHRSSCDSSWIANCRGCTAIDRCTFAGFCQCYVETLTGSR